MGEAEERYANRGKILNKWAVMVNKKLKPGEEGGEEDPDEDGAKNKKGKKKESFKVSDMDDWEDGDALDTSDDENDKKDDSDSDGGKKKRTRLLDRPQLLGNHLGRTRLHAHRPREEQVRHCQLGRVPRLLSDRCTARDEELCLRMEIRLALLPTLSIEPIDICLSIIQ